MNQQCCKTYKSWIILINLQFASDWLIIHLEDRLRKGQYISLHMKIMLKRRNVLPNAIKLHFFAIFKKSFFIVFIHYFIAREKKLCSTKVRLSYFNWNFELISTEMLNLFQLKCWTYFNWNVEVISTEMLKTFQLKCWSNFN